MPPSALALGGQESQPLCMASHHALFTEMPESAHFWTFTYIMGLPELPDKPLLLGGGGGQSSWEAELGGLALAAGKWVG